MYIIKEGVSKKDKRLIEQILYNCVDLYGDFYSTKSNIRISLRDNPDEVFSYLRKGSKFAFENNNEQGIAIILKEKGFRTYVKVLTRDLNLATNLLKIINWNISEDLYVKIHKNNPLIKAFQRQGFKIKGDRGSEFLLYRQYIARPKRIYNKDSEGE